MGRAGRKRKFHGSDPGKTKSEKQPDDKIRASRQPHRRPLEEADRGKFEAESPIGRLLLAGLLRRADDRDETAARWRYQASELFASVVGAYRSVIEAPKDVAGSGRGFPCTPSVCAASLANEDLCECLTRRRRYEKAYEALADDARIEFWGDVDDPLHRAIIEHTKIRDDEKWKKALRDKRRALMAVIRVAIHREPIADGELIYLTIGLDKLVRHFGLADRRSKERATIAPERDAAQTPA